MIENFLSENNCIISNKIIKPTPVLSNPVLPNYIVFADPEVERICVENWGSGGEITYEQAAIVTDLGSVFTNNTSIISFDELQYFTFLKDFGAFTFAGCANLTSIVIPNSVISLGYATFQGCSNLIKVILPNAITSIGENDFINCTSLSNINIPNSVTSIGVASFRYCQGLISINIPNAITSIGDYSFADCTNLTSINITSVTPPTLGADAFLNDTNLTNIYVPNASVDAYKAAAGWSDYASIITAIIKPT